MWDIQGAATNAISGEVHIVCEGQSRFFVVINVMRQGDLLPLQGTNRPVFAALSCGLIELRDNNGGKIPLLKNSIFSPKLYPDTFNITNQAKLIPIDKNKFTSMLLPAPQSRSPDFLREPGKNYSIALFNLNSYFKPTKTGVYILTIWPKIYKKSETNEELYERIDLPPVTIPIKWAGT